MARDRRPEVRARSHELLKLPKSVENCSKYERDAGGGEEADFFREAEQKQRELADRAKQLLSQRLS